MNRVKILLPVVLLITTFPFAALGQDNLFKIQGNAPSSYDVGQIQRMILRIVMGIQNQRPYLVYMHFHPDQEAESPATWDELDQIKITLEKLFNTLSRRSPADKLFPGMTDAFDFMDLHKTLEFKRNGSQAELLIELGFNNLPGDPSLLENLPVEILNTLSVPEKVEKSKFRTVKLEFHKMDGAWYLSSLANLHSEFRNMIDYYDKLDLSPAKIKN